MPPETLSRRLLKLFKAPVSWVLAGVILLELVLRQWSGAAGFALLAFVTFAARALLEYQAWRALEELRLLFEGSASTCRGGTWQSIPASRLAPGDQIRLQAGDRVPADVLILEGRLLVENRGSRFSSEAAEGSPVLAGGAVLRGEATAWVAIPGVQSRLGRPWAAWPDEQAGPLQLAARRFDALLLIGGGLGYVFALAAGAAAGLPRETGLMLGLLLLVASGLAGSAALLHAALAQGARELQRDGELLTRLRAMEDLAGMQVMILEKDGLLTEENLSLAQVQAFAPYAESDVLHLAAMACDETAHILEDRVILAQPQSGSRANLKQRTAFTPYDPARRLSEAIYEEDGQPLRVLKGAPAAILGLVDGNQEDLYPPIHALAARGCRVTVVAVGTGSALQVAGLLAFQDPLRGDARPLIQRLKEMGVRVVMATSDGRATAQALAQQAGLEGLLYPGDVLGEEPGERLAGCDVIAGLTADQKAGLVEGYQRAGITVGITGSSLADARALRSARAGVALLPAVDSARDAAALVVNRPHLSHLVEAVHACRERVAGMLAAVEIPAARLAWLIIFLLLGMLFGHVLPVPPKALLVWLALSQVEAVVLVRERGTDSGRWRLPSLGAASLARALPALVVSLAVYWAARALAGLPPSALQTLATVQLFLSGQMILFHGRLRGPRPGWELLAFSALQVMGVLLLAGAGLLLAPLPWDWLLGLVLVNAAVFVGVEWARDGRSVYHSGTETQRNP